MPPLQSVFIVCSPGRAEPKLSCLRVSAAGPARGERERERERASDITQVQSASCSTSLFPASSMLQYASIFFIPPLVDGSLSFNSLIALSALSIHLCLYGLTLQLNSVLFGWDGHTITGPVRRWGVPLSKRGGENVSCFEKPMEGTIKEKKL